MITPTLNLPYIHQQESEIPLKEPYITPFKGAPYLKQIELQTTAARPRLPSARAGALAGGPSKPGLRNGGHHSFQDSKRVQYERVKNCQRNFEVCSGI